MKRKIEIQIANPAGNVTVFVRTRFERENYINVANQLLDLYKEAEQVAFIQDKPYCGRPLGKMEMCGLEFCGNASRSFALMIARENGITGETVIPVDVSGVNEILDVFVNTETGFTKIKMPEPERIIEYEISGSKYRAVDFGGIFHVILNDVSIDMDLFEKIKNDVNKRFNPPAMGVMFWDEKSSKLDPVVYVKDVDTTYHEGSCGSGTTAISCAMGLSMGDGEHRFTVNQPAGKIDSSVIIKNGKVSKVYIEGPVTVSDIIEAEVEV